MADNFIRGLAVAARRLRALGRTTSSNALLAEIDHAALPAAELANLSRINRAPGISVIMPTYKGVAHIGRSLESVAAQTLDPERFELVVVLNGPEDGTGMLLAKFRTQHPQVNVQVLSSHPAHAGHARNTGLQAAKFEHVTFLDDDDYLTPTFLEAALNKADGTSVVFCGLKDETAGVLSDSQAYQKMVQAFAGRDQITVADTSGAGTALTMTCIKVFPAYMADAVAFHTDLKNGEDVVFWSEIMHRFDPVLKMVPSGAEAFYVRNLRDNSVSRQQVSFQFHVRDRLAVVRELERIDPSRSNPMVSDKINAALEFTAQYIRQDRSSYEAVLDHIYGCGLQNPDAVRERLNRRIARKLSVSFCFPPWGDTAGVVAAKRIAQDGEPTDVISANLSSARERDEGLYRICDRYLAQHVELNIPTISFGQGATSVQFTDRALAMYGSLKKSRQYESLYSRALWPASHFAAAAIKAQDPALHWVAEFSDPLLLDIFSKERGGTIDLNWLDRVGISTAIEQAGAERLETPALFLWAEYVAYILADELLFTNENQMQHMLSQAWVAPWRDRIAAKARFSPHPTPAPALYDLTPADCSLEANRVNIAYFGNFYKTRGLNDLLTAFGGVSAQDRAKLCLHVFSGEEAGLAQAIAEHGLEAEVRLQGRRPYFEFLNLSRQFDYLLVNDAETRGIKEMNPYLPSKLSDYLGAGRSIWALVEEGSPMSRVNLPEGSILSPLGDVSSYQRVLKTMADTAQRRQ